MPPVKAKKRCCHSDPRCKRCPVVLRRLERAGYAERSGRRIYRVTRTLPKRVLKLARA